MRQRRLSLLGLSFRRLAHQPGLAAALTLGLVAAVALAAAVPLVQAVATEAGLRSTLAGLGDTGNVTVEQFNTADANSFEAFQREAGSRVRDGAGSSLRPGAEFASFGPLFPVSLNDQALHADVGDPHPTLAYYRDLGAHVKPLAGQLPADSPTTSTELPASLSEAAASIFKLKVGDRYCTFFTTTVRPPFPGGPTPSAICTRIAAVWRAADSREPYWGGNPPRLFLMVGRDDLFSAFNPNFARTPPVAGRYFAPQLSAINAQNAGDVVQRLNQLRGYFTVRRQGFFATSVDTSMKRFLDRQRVASFTVQLIAAALLLVALYSVAFVAGHFLEAQARELTVLRARGWRRRRVWALLMIQLGTLAALALPLGLVVAGVAISFLTVAVFGSSAPRLTPGDVAGVAPTLCAALAGGLVLMGVLAAGAARRDAMELRRSASRPAAAPWWRWRNVDLGLGLAAIPLLAESRLRGSSLVRDVAAADDPLSLLFPALALAFLAIACLRLLPGASRLAGRLGRGLPASLASWQLARRPTQHSSLALLLTFAVALGVLSAIYSATERRNTVDRAAYQAGADLRVTYLSNQQPLRLDALARAAPGLAGSSAAYRTNGSPGATLVEATVLGIDPGSFPSAAWSRQDLYGGPLSKVVGPLLEKDPDGLELPGKPSTLSVWAFSSGLDTHLVAHLNDREGRSCACDLGGLDYAGWRRLQVSLHFPGASAAAYPLRLRDLVILQATTGRTAGQLALSDLGADQSVVEGFDRPDGWWLATVGTSSQAEDVSPSASRARDDGRQTLPIDVHLERGDLLLRPAATSRPLPALLSSTTLQTLGVGLNQPFPIHVDSYGVQVTAVGVLDYFPTLYPGQEQFIVLPRDSLLGRLARDGSTTAWPNELWVKVDRGGPALTSRLRDAGQVLQLSDRHEIESAALSDPLRLALDGTLVVGVLSALVMAVVGFGLHSLVAARARHSEYAVLRANGLSASVVRRSLAVEQAVLLGYSLVAGSLLGGVVAFAVLPAVQLGSDPSDYIPPTVVTLEPSSLLAAGGAVLAGGLLVGWLARRASSRLRLLEELRQLG